MGPVSIAAVGWFIGSLINNVVMESLEAWAKRLKLGDEFETLKIQLLQLDAHLTSARSIRTNNRFLDELVQNVQQLAYQAENLLDELDYYRLQDQIKQRGTQEQENCSYRPLVASSSSGQLLASHSIISTIEGLYIHSAPYAPVPLPETSPLKINLSRRMNELAGQLQKSEENLRNALQTEAQVNTARNTEICQTESTNLPQTSPFHTETGEVVGRNKQRDQLLNLLKNEESATVGKVLVVAIVGCGGVGKTTLAGLVFNDPNIFFDVRSWICVSTRFNIVRLTCEMLEGACGISFDKLTNLEALQKKLKDKLASKRFLLVLDDMWEDKDKSEWVKMIALLNNCMLKRGVILVTTRNQSVANMVNARDNIYLEGLDDNAFLSFFSSCIFSDSNFKGNERLRSIGGQIANKLKGNPLAAKTVSALLKESNDEGYWMEIRDSKEWKFQSDPNDIMPALRLSYEHMPFHLQRCFSYCAIFPEDHPFTSNELVYLWMAQGFLDVRSKGKRMEDIGRIYFNDLFNRGFFQTKQTNYGLARYTFHDLLRDLACMVSDKECLSINGTEPRQIPPTIRHLSIFNSTERGQETIVRALECLKGENLSTIIDWHELSSVTFKSILDLLKETKFLRAVTLNLCLDVRQEYFNFQNFVSLRYLKLIVPINSTFPREICKLYHLEVFQIEGGNIVELPNNFSNLVSLRHFIASGTLHSKIWGVGKLTSLQGLTNFDVRQREGFEIEQLGSLKEIRGSLQIRNLENVKSKEEASKARLAEKEKLDTLYLQWKQGAQENESVLEGLKPSTKLRSLDIFGYGGVVSPTWLESSSLIFLESLTLKFCTAWEMLPPIGELESLKYLRLINLGTREIGPQCYGTQQSMKFPSLEELEIMDMPNLEKWVWSTDHLQQFLCFKKLKKLTIQDCPKLGYLPLSRCATSVVLERFPSLQSLTIQDCPLIFQLSPLPYSSRLYFISIINSGIIRSMYYNKEEDQMLSLVLDQSSSIKVCELLAFHELSSLHSLEIYHSFSFKSFLEVSSWHVPKLSNISKLDLDLHCLVALKTLVIEGCQSLASLTFGEHLVQLTSLKIISCERLRSIEGLKSWVNLKWLRIHKCPGFISAWDSASKEILKTEPNFSLSLTTIESDSLALLTLPICKQLTSLQFFELEFSVFTEDDKISPQLLTSIDLVDISGCKNLQSFPFHLFPSLKELRITFPQIRTLPTNNCDEITRECLKLRNIKIVNFSMYPVKIHFGLRLEEMICQHMDADN